jgi:hypothetical protein
MVMSPPMAAMFFNGTLGSFAANSSFGNVGRNSTGQQSDFKQDFVNSDKLDGGKGRGTGCTARPNSEIERYTHPYR